MTKNPVRKRRKHVHLSAEGWLANAENAKVNLAWDDVYITYKEKPGRNAKIIYAGPCLISRIGLAEDLRHAIRNEREYTQIINEGEPEEYHYTRQQHYENELTMYNNILDQLDAGIKFVIENESDPDGHEMPGIYMNVLNRKTAEEAIKWYLKSRGVNDPKLIWKRSELLIWPC